MANTQSAEIALLYASPPGIADRNLVGSSHVRTQGTVEFNATTAADTLQICRLPVDAVLTSVKFAFDDVGTSGTFDIGFYQVGEPGTVIDLDAIGTVIDVGAADISFTEYRFEDLDIDTNGDRIWELAGLSDRPSYEEVDLVITVAASNTVTAKTVSWIIEYTR